MRRSRVSWLCRTTAPWATTSLTFSSAAASSKGFAATDDQVGAVAARQRPTRSDQPSSRAAFVVAARIASRCGSPASTSSRTSLPIGSTSVPNESVPATTVTPRACASRTAACRIGRVLCARAGQDRVRRGAMPVIAAIVGVK